MGTIMKKMCSGCPYDYGQDATEMAYNLGCLPSIGEVTERCEQNGTVWACHHTASCLCAGYAEAHPDRLSLPLELVEGVHPRPSTPTDHASHGGEGRHR